MSGNDSKFVTCQVMTTSLSHVGWWHQFVTCHMLGDDSKFVSKFDTCHAMIASLSHFACHVMATNLSQVTCQVMTASLSHVRWWQQVFHMSHAKWWQQVCHMSGDDSRFILHTLTLLAGRRLTRPSPLPSWPLSWSGSTPLGARLFRWTALRQYLKLEKIASLHEQRTTPAFENNVITTHLPPNL